MRTAIAAGAMVVAVLLATAAATPAPAPALRLRRAVPMSGLEHLRKLDRARLVKRSQGVGEFALLSSPGIYYANVNFGSPPKQYSLQFDTGSDLMWVSCSSCTNCPDTNNIGARWSFTTPTILRPRPTYHALIIGARRPSKQGIRSAKSSTLRTTNVPMTWPMLVLPRRGIMCLTPCISTPSCQRRMSRLQVSPPVIFGCSNSRSSNMEADGVMGFGKNAPSVILQLNSQGVSPKVFSHCLKSSEDGGGILVLGEVVEPGFVFTPLVSSQARYNLNMESMAINGQKIPLNSSLFTTSNTQGTFVDSGTSLSYLADGVYDPVISAIDKAVPQSISSYFFNGHLCYIIELNSSKSKISLFPVLTLNFEGGARMRVDPANYLLRKGASANPHDLDIMCLGFLKSKDLEAYEHITILGDLVLQDKIIVYNLEEMRLGWLDYNCSLLNKTTTPVTTSVSGSFRRHTPSYCSRLMIALVVAVIIAPWRLDI